MAFSVLSMLDGCSSALPGFIVAPFAHKDDKEYSIEQGEDYFPLNDRNSVIGDIAGDLHEKFFRK